MQPLVVLILMIVCLVNETPCCRQGDRSEGPARMPYAEDAVAVMHACCEVQPCVAATDALAPTANAEAVASVADFTVAIAYMPCADEDRPCYLPCCRERTPWVQEATGACRGPDDRIAMPRADELVVAPLFLPCAVRLARTNVHQTHMPRADEQQQAENTDVYMPRADDDAPRIKAVAAGPTR